MEYYLTWIIENKEAILLGLTGIVTGASVIVKGCEIIAKLTPCKWDNKVVAWLYKFIRILSIPLKQKGVTK